MRLRTLGRVLAAIYKLRPSSPRGRKVSSSKLDTAPPPKARTLLTGATAMATMASPPPVDVDLGKLSYEIFSLLESNFLFGAAAAGGGAAGGGRGVCSLPGTPGRAFLGGGGGGGRVRVLAIDGCGPGPGDALLAAAALVRLETALREKAGDGDARLADFFDAAAGAGAGGVLAAMLFLKGPDGRPRYKAADALAFVAASLGKGGWRGGGRRRWVAALFRRGSAERSSLRRVFGDATLRDTVAPLLVPCYDVATAAPFLFSRADAVESDSFDFRLRDVCAATCAGGATTTAVRSVDGRTAIAAASGGVAAMGNPTAAAITHVLHNKQEFPLAAGVDDLLVVSIGSGSSSGSITTASSATPSSGGWRTPLPSRSPSPAEMVRLTAEGVADMVDQAVAMAFGHVWAQLRPHPGGVAGLHDEGTELAGREEGGGDRRRYADATERGGGAIPGAAAVGEVQPGEAGRVRGGAREGARPAAGLAGAPQRGHQAGGQRRRRRRNAGASLVGDHRVVRHHRHHRHHRQDHRLQHAVAGGVAGLRPPLAAEIAGRACRSFVHCRHPWTDRSRRWLFIIIFLSFDESMSH